MYPLSNTFFVFCLCLCMSTLSYRKFPQAPRIQGRVDYIHAIIKNDMIVKDSLWQNTDVYIPQFIKNDIIRNHYGGYHAVHTCIQHLQRMITIENVEEPFLRFFRVNATVDEMNKVQEQLIRWMEFLDHDPDFAYTYISDFQQNGGDNVVGMGVHRVKLDSNKELLYSFKRMLYYPASMAETFHPWLPKNRDGQFPLLLHEIFHILGHTHGPNGYHEIQLVEESAAIGDFKTTSRNPYAYDSYFAEVTEVTFEIFGITGCALKLNFNNNKLECDFTNYRRTYWTCEGSSVRCKLKVISPSTAAYDRYIKENLMGTDVMVTSESAEASFVELKFLGTGVYVINFISINHLALNIDDGKSLKVEFNAIPTATQYWELSLLGVKARTRVGKLKIKDGFEYLSVNAAGELVWAGSQNEAVEWTFLGPTNRAVLRYGKKFLNIEKCGQCKNKQTDSEESGIVAKLDDKPFLWNLELVSVILIKKKPWETFEPLPDSDDETHQPIEFDSDSIIPPLEIITIGYNTNSWSKGPISRYLSRSNKYPKRIILSYEINMNPIIFEFEDTPLDMKHVDDFFQPRTDIWEKERIIE